MKPRECTSEVAACLQRARRRMDAVEYNAAAHECRNALEAITSYIYAEVLHKPFSPREGLNNAINAGDFKALWPPLLRVRIACVKEIGDQGSHANQSIAEDEAVEAFNALGEVIVHFEEHFVGHELGLLVKRSPLRIDVATDLSKITFEKADGQSLVVDRPLLLLESLAGRNKAFRFTDPSLETPNLFAKRELGGQILKLIGDANLVRFGDAEVLWDEGYSEWPPSIDSLFSASLMLGDPGLRQEMASCRRFAEVGCGTAFISSVVCRAHQIEALCLTDIHDRVLDLAEFNVLRNAPKQVIARKRGPGLRAFNLGPNSFDAIFANPPYIRVNPDEVESAHATRSTGLLDEIVQDFWRYSKRLILNYSSCCEAAVDDILLRVNGDGIRIGKRIVRRRAVPFRVVGMSADEVATLAGQGRLIDLQAMEQRTRWPALMADNRGYRFWHEIILAVFTADGGRS